jgi:hypothetical protein
MTLYLSLFFFSFYSLLHVLFAWVLYMLPL